MQDVYSGSCMCGHVTFSFRGAPKFVSECVCESCRRAHGASVVGWVGVEAERFRLDDGESEVAWYASSPESERGFCTRCGTRLFFRSSKWAGEMHMALACMLEPHGLMVKAIAFREETPEWTAMTPTI